MPEEGIEVHRTVSKKAQTGYFPTMSKEDIAVNIGFSPTMSEEGIKVYLSKEGKEVLHV